MTNWYIIILLFVSVLFVGAITFVFHNFFKNIRHYLTTVGVSFVLSLVCVHILPEIFQGNTKNIGAYLLLGFVIQIVLELFSRGIEHGHVHNHNADGSITVKRTLISMFFGLCVHSLIEGIPLFLIDDVDSGCLHDHNHSHNHTHSILTNEGEFSNVFFWAILGHKIPVAIVLMLFLIHSKISNNKIFLLFILFAIMTPLGGMLGIGMESLEKVNEISKVLLAITTGMLIHITTLLVFEEYHNQRDKIKNIGLIITGLVLGLITFG